MSMGANAALLLAEVVELLEHSFKYIFWFIGVFGVMLSVFLLTARLQELKNFFVILGF